MFGHAMTDERERQRQLDAGIGLGAEVRFQEGPGLLRGGQPQGRGRVGAHLRALVIERRDHRRRGAGNASATPLQTPGSKCVTDASTASDWRAAIGVHPKKYAGASSRRR